MLDKLDLTQKIDKETYKRIMPELGNRLFNVQKASWDANIPIVILFEGWDAAGKGTSVQKLTRSLDPRGYKLYPIRAARTFEAKHPWLWRFWLKIPACGEWAIFDRSWYGRVMVERVENLIPESEWRRAYRDIIDFERALTDDGTLIIKFFLHISRQEQKRRFEKLIKDPLTSWHVSPEDWEHYRRYDDWLVAYEEAFERTESEWAPWTIVEATDRRFTWVKIHKTVIKAVEERLGLPYTPLPGDQALVPAIVEEEQEFVEAEEQAEEEVTSYMALIEEGVSARSSPMSEAEFPQEAPTFPVEEEGMMESVEQYLAPFEDDETE